jgi:protocatechuate 3,4-dioxygenase beta subunit
LAYQNGRQFGKSGSYKKKHREEKSGTLGQRKATDSNSLTGSTPSPGAIQGNSKIEEMRRGLSILNDQEIVLFGKVADQFGNPLGGVTVEGSTIYDSGFASGVVAGLMT